MFLGGRLCVFTTMAISPERKQFIADLANDEWVGRFDEEAPDSDARFEVASEAISREREQFLTEATDPEELHRFAELWNWDGGYVAMLMLTRNSACDAGTALMVYWLAQPEFYLRYASRDEVSEWEHEGYDFVTELEGRIVADDFATRQIPYDPRADGLVSGEVGQAKRELPSVVYEPVRAGESDE